ncbi:MAG: ABC transporter ATP-binding protein [Opitutaceae bacterium]
MKEDRPSILSFLYRGVATAKLTLATMLVFLLLDGLFQSLVPIALRNAIDTLVLDSGADHHQEIWSTIVLGLIIAGGWILSAIIQRYCSTKLTTVLSMQTRLDLYAHLQKLGLDFFHRNKVGDLTTRLNEDVEIATKTLFETLQFIIWAMALFVPSAIAMFMLNRALFTVFVLICFVLIFALAVCVPYFRKKEKAIRDQQGKINAMVTEHIQSMMLIKGHSREDSAYEQVGQEMDTFMGMRLQTSKLMVTLSGCINGFIGAIAPMILIVTGLLLHKQGVTAGVIAAFFAYWLVISGPIKLLVQRFNFIMPAFASYERIVSLYEEVPKVNDCKSPVELDEVDTSVHFEDVSFAYSSNPNREVIQKFSMSIKTNESIGLVGQTGAGKTTLANLIMRFYDPSEGSVRIGETDIRHVKQADLHDAIALVMQDPILLSGTIRENLLFVQPDADEASLIYSLKQAKAWRFVQSLPGGLDCEIGERGVRLSGGQRQRLAIACAFLKNPSILIFDEATSALDSTTEAEIQTAITNLLKGRTSIAIAHRLSTILSCDKIAYIEQGQLVGYAPHRELFNTLPAYRELCEKQFIEAETAVNL